MYLIQVSSLLKVVGRAREQALGWTPYKASENKTTKLACQESCCLCHTYKCRDSRGCWVNQKSINSLKPRIQKPIIATVTITIPVGL